MWAYPGRNHQVGAAHRSYAMNYCIECRQNFAGAVRNRFLQPSCPTCGSSAILPAKPEPFVVYDPPDPTPLPPPHCRDRLRPRGLRRNSDLVPLIAARDGWECHICGEPIDPAVNPNSRVGATIDHLMPLSEGGSRWRRSNMRLAHRGCNNARGSQPARMLRASIP
jgi:predicted RNA-binding Zn-ribbon protein involved in translation (DUF1610 family)